MLHLSLKSPLWFALFYKEKPLKVHPSRGPYRFIFYIFAAISYIKDKTPRWHFCRLGVFAVVRGLNHSRRNVWKCDTLFSAVGSRARHEQGMPACGSIPQP